MEKQLIIQRLKDTIKMLRGLKPEEFDYSSFITKQENLCGTVCCVAGWYPKYFPKANLRWYANAHSSVFLESTLQNKTVKQTLCMYHGVDLDVISALFFGFSYCQLNIPTAIDREARIKSLSIEEVVERFKIVLNYYEN